MYSSYSLNTVFYVYVYVAVALPDLMIVSEH